MTAEDSLSLYDTAYSIKCHRNDAFGNERMKRGKPHKLETQIMVGESPRPNSRYEEEGKP